MENELLLFNAENIINDEEFLLLREINQQSSLHACLPYWKYERFNLEDIEDDECEVEMRFKKDDIIVL